LRFPCSSSWRGRSRSRRTGKCSHCSDGWGGAYYALYAIHEPLANISEFLAETNPEIPYRVWSLPFFVAAMALAFALDRMFDAPFRRWLTQKFLARHAKAPVDANAPGQETRP